MFLKCYFDSDAHMCLCLLSVSVFVSVFLFVRAYVDCIR